MNGAVPARSAPGDGEGSATAQAGTHAPPSPDAAATAPSHTAPAHPAPRRVTPAPRRTARRPGWFAVLEREFLVATSLGGFVALRTAIVALEVLVALFYLAVSATFDGSVDGLELFRVAAVGPLLACVLLAPALSASSIASERAMDTLPIILAAPVSPTGFVLAKFAARLGVVIIPLIGTIPVVVVGFAFGGPSGALLVTYLGLLTLLAVFGVAVGVCASAFSANVAKATLWAYGGAVLFPILEMPFVTWVAQDVVGPGVPDTILLAHNPLFATLETLLMGPAVLVQPAIFVLVLSAIALLAASRRMAREFAVASGGRKARAPLPLRFEDPVRSRAVPRTIVVPTDLRSLGVLVVMTLPMLIPILGSRWDDDEIVVGMFIATWITTIYLLVRASQTIAPERQRGSLALLLATPITARHFVDAHFVGLFCHAARLLFPAFAVGALAVADGEVRFGQFAAWCFATAVLIGIHVAVGIWRSAAATTGGRAAASAISAMFVTSIVWGLVALGATWLADKTSLHEEAVGIPMVAVIPAAWHGMLIGTAGESSWSRDDSLAFWCSLLACLATIRVCFALRRRAHLALKGDVA